MFGICKQNSKDCWQTKASFLKGLCNWFFFFMFRFKIVSREEEVENIQKNQQIVEKNER